jgi:hypothetical protein
MGRMKTNIAIGVLVIIGVSSCNETPKEKRQEAIVDVTGNKTNLDTAKMNYEMELANYKSEAMERVVANEKKLNEFKADIANEKRLVKNGYQRKITDLESKNLELKSRVSTYVAPDRVRWYEFKEKCDKDMQCIQNDIKTTCLQKSPE